MDATWWQDEPELLGEALSIIADFENGSSHGSSSSSSPCTSSTSGTEPLVGSSPLAAIADNHGTRQHRGSRPVKINHSRERQKQEMRQLQASVVALEEELLRLRMKRENRPQQPPAAFPSASFTALTTTSPGTRQNNSAIAVWEKTTRRQFHARKKAESVNAKLREMLRTQASVADELVRIIQRAEAARQEMYGTALVPQPDATFTLSRAASDQELEMRLLRLSAQWHVPFATCPKFQCHGAQPRELYFFETAVVHDDDAESTLDIFASTVFPFPRHVLEVELWNYFRTLNCTEDDFSLTSESRETCDTLTGSLRATSTKDGVVGVLDARFMKQQFRNEHGELIITSTTCGRPGIRPTARGASRDASVVQVDAIVTEDSWLRVMDADDTAGMTCIQNVRRTRILFGSTGRPNRRQVEAVKTFLSHLAHNEMRWGSEVVERTIMLAAMSCPEPPSVL